MVYCTLHIHLSYTMQTSNIKEQLHSVSLLLRDKNFAQEMAQYLEAAYYTSKGEEAPAFSEEGIHNRYTTCLLIEEKIAVSIAAFYALECAIGQLIYSKGGNPFDWLIKIKDRTTDEADRLVMHCFANAAWKAGQPYRGIDRITRDNFISASGICCSTAAEKRDNGCCKQQCEYSIRKNQQVITKRILCFGNSTTFRSCILYRHPPACTGVFEERRRNCRNKTQPD